MTSVGTDWAVVALFCVLLIGVIVGEVLWLVRTGRATSGRAVVYVLVTDLVSLGLSGAFSLFFALLMLMLVFGPSGTGPTPGSGPAMWVTLAGALIFPPLILFLMKRALISILRTTRGRAAWIYSLSVTVLILLVVLVPTVLFIYFA